MRHVGTLSDIAIILFLKFSKPFFSRPLPKADRELQTELNTRRIMDDDDDPSEKPAKGKC